VRKRKLKATKKRSREEKMHRFAKAERQRCARNGAIPKLTPPSISAMYFGISAQNMIFSICRAY